MVGLRERRRQEVRDEVRGVAIGMMAERGFDGVTVEEIAASTSVSPSTIYRHFGTKEALVLTPGRPEQIVERVRDDAKRTDLEAIRRAVNRVYGKDPDVPGELMLVVGNAGLADQFRRELAAHGPLLAEALAARNGRTEPALADQARAAAVLAAVTVALLEWARRTDAKLTKSLDPALAVIA